MLTLVLATTNAHKVEEIQAYLAGAAASGIQVQALPFALEVEETGQTFMENARIKAEAARKAFSLSPLRGEGGPQDRERVTTWILAEDSGFVVHALAGVDDLAEFPGVRSNRWLTPERRADLLGQPVTASAITDTERCLALWALMDRFLSPEGQPLTDFSAHYTCAMVALPLNHASVSGGEALMCEGQMPLLLNRERVLKGTQGFGYDPMVFPLVDGQPLPQTVAELATPHKNALSHRGKALQSLLPLLGSPVF